jgi:hypothetical protein
MPLCYTDRLSAYPGETVTLHARASKNPCGLEIARVGADRIAVLSREGLAPGDHPTPDHADRNGCSWPAVFDFVVGADWQSGYYDIVLTDAAGDAAHHFICVKPARDRPRAKAAFVLATNTYHAYNYFGGANAYCDVAGLMSRRKKLAEAMEGGIGVLSTLRPFAQAIVAAPTDVPRLVTSRKRDFREKPFVERMPGASPYDRSAGFLNKWEHAFVRWAEAEGLALDYFTDFDLDAEPDVLDPYAVLIVAGHSEYWSARQRDCVEAFVDRGGGFAIFSGNTAFWKVRFEDGGKTFICHKWRGFDSDPVANADPQAATHLWSHKTFARPEAEMTGLTFLFGGYHRLGGCVARGQAGYTVYNERHWALAGSDLFYGDVIGADIAFLGYENDGCRFRFDRDGRPQPLPELGVPQNLEIIALAPTAFGEDLSSGYPMLIPPENLSIIAREVFGEQGAAAEDRILRGHAVMASFTRGKGEVFNGGTTEWAHGLAADDPFIAQITRNVLRRFGAW